MREIKFRGKQRDGGEWLMGDLLQAKTPSGRQQCWIFHDIHGNNEVDPATVGQFTGLKDKNGRKIYEGDVVKTTSIMDEVIVGDVVWDENSFLYAVDIGCELMEFHNIIHTEKMVEVIGNVHDNPELLHDTQD